jgi:hypothetical protein
MNSVKPPKRREMDAGKDVLRIVKGCSFVRVIWIISEKLQTQWNAEIHFLIAVAAVVHFRAERELGHRKLHVNNTARYVRTRE